MGGLPLVYIFVMAILRIDSHSMIVSTFDRCLSFVSIINPVLAIYFVKPYRDTIKRVFWCPCKADNQVSAIQETDQHVQVTTKTFQRSP